MFFSLQEFWLQANARLNRVFANTLSNNQAVLPAPSFFLLVPHIKKSPFAPIRTKGDKFFKPIEEFFPNEENMHFRCRSAHASPFLHGG